MSKVCLILLIGALVLGAGLGCKTESGSREYIPGKGWMPTD